MLPYSKFKLKIFEDRMIYQSKSDLKDVFCYNILIWYQPDINSNSAKFSMAEFSNPSVTSPEGKIPFCLKMWLSPPGSGLVYGCHGNHQLGFMMPIHSCEWHLLKLAICYALMYHYIKGVNNMVAWKLWNFLCIYMILGVKHHTYSHLVKHK